MSRGPQTFRQGDMTKAVKAVVAAGVGVLRVEVDGDGKIVVVVDNSNTQAEAPRKRPGHSGPIVL